MQDKTVCGPPVEGEDMPKRAQAFSTTGNRSSASRGMSGAGEELCDGDEAFVRVISPGPAETHKEMSGTCRQGTADFSF